MRVTHVEVASDAMPFLVPLTHPISILGATGLVTPIKPHSREKLREGRAQPLRKPLVLLLAFLWSSTPLAVTISLFSLLCYNCSDHLLKILVLLKCRSSSPML